MAFVTLLSVSQANVHIAIHAEQLAASDYLEKQFAQLRGKKRRKVEPVITGELWHTVVDGQPGTLVYRLTSRHGTVLKTATICGIAFASLAVSP